MKNYLFRVTFIQSSNSLASDYSNLKSNYRTKLIEIVTKINREHDSNVYFEEVALSQRPDIVILMNSDNKWEFDIRKLKSEEIKDNKFFIYYKPEFYPGSFYSCSIGSYIERKECYVIGKSGAVSKCHLENTILSKTILYDVPSTIANETRNEVVGYLNKEYFKEKTIVQVLGEILNEPEERARGCELPYQINNVLLFLL